MSTFNVLRWSALGAGVVYGFVHRNGLKNAAEEKAAADKFAQQEKLIQEAKAEYAKLNAQKTPAASTGSINWEDPNLDIGKALESLIEKLN